MDEAKNRIEWIDIAKGIGIIAVLVGHTISYSVPEENFIRSVIYSFHMPLFFILSALVYNFSKSDDEFIKKAKRAFGHLVLPVIVWFGLIFLWKLMSVDSKDIKEFIIDRFLILIFANGVDVDFMGKKITGIGIPWFMISLFVGRTMFDFVYLKIQNRKLFTIVIAIMTLIGMVIGKYQWLPFTLDLSLQILPFFYFGLLIRNCNFGMNAVRNMFISAFVWGGLFLLYVKNSNNYYDLSWRWHPLYPISDIAAIFGTLMVVYFSNLISKLKFVKSIRYLGQNSLIFLWIHIIDDKWSILWNRAGNNYVNFILRFACDLVVFLIIMCIKQWLELRKKK